MSASILVVDDEAGIRELLSWELTNHGYDVVPACDGVEAIDHVRRTEFDLIISDVRMPRADGLSVLRSAKEMAPDTEVVVATGYAELEYAVECVRHGAFDFVQKPFNTADLLAIVSRALEHRRLRWTTGLYEASRSILDGHEPHRLPELIVELSKRAMQADDASLLAAGGRDLASLTQPSVIAGPLTDDPRFAHLTYAHRAKSSIVYPLLVGQRLLGVLCMTRFTADRPFRPGEMQRATILASQVLLALENARLFRQVASSERLASVGLLATAVAHEINSPASYVLVNQSILQERLVELERVTSLIDAGADARIVREAWSAVGGGEFHTSIAQVMQDLADGAQSICDIARDLKTLGRHDAKASRFDINEPVRSALRVAAAQLREQAVVKTELEADLQVLGSPGRLSQVFVNLLVNAAQACAESAPADDKNHVITVRTQLHENQVVATVTDSGPGIREEHLPRIFDTFFTTKEATVGTGLGLSISRDIVLAHGGDLRVESTFGQGATFIVTLPLAGVVRRFC